LTKTSDSPITSLIFPALDSCISRYPQSSKNPPYARSKKTASIITTSIFHARLDYCNSLCLNIGIIQISCLQAIQNALDHAVTKTPKHHHITLVLKNSTGLQYLNESNTKQYHSPITAFPKLWVATHFWTAKFCQVGRQSSPKLLEIFIFLSLICKLNKNTVYLIPLLS